MGAAVFSWVLWSDSGVCYYQVRTSCGKCIPLADNHGSHPWYGTNLEKEKMVTSHKQTITVQKRRRLNQAVVKANSEALARDGFLSSYQPLWKLFEEDEVEDKEGKTRRSLQGGGGEESTEDIDVITTEPSPNTWRMMEELIWPEVSTENCAYGSGHIIPAEVLALSAAPDDSSSTTPFISDAGNTMLTGGNKWEDNWMPPADSHVHETDWIDQETTTVNFQESLEEYTYLDPMTYGEFLYPPGDSRLSVQKDVPRYHDREGQWYFTAWDTAVRGPYVETDLFGMANQDFPEHLELYCGRNEPEPECQEICDCLDGYLYSHDVIWAILGFVYTAFCLGVCICPCYVMTLKSRIEGIQVKTFGHAGNFQSGGGPMVAPPVIVQQPMMMAPPQPQQQNINITVNAAGAKPGGNSEGETCGKCGNEFTEDAQFCRKCGHPRGMPWKSKKP